MDKPRDYWEEHIQWMEQLLFTNKAMPELCSSVNVWMLQEQEPPVSADAQKQLGGL